MMKIWDFLMRRRVFSYFLLSSIIFLGLFSMFSLPRESTPEVQIPIAIISTPYFGATAEDVESLVTNEIEDAVADISGIDTIESTSSSGFSMVMITFNQNEDIDEKLTEVRDEIEKMKRSLPADAQEVTVSDFNFSDQPIIIFSLSGQITDYEFKQITDALKEELEDIPGASKVTVSGLAEEEISISIKPQKLEQYQLSVLQVAQAITAANDKTPTGKITIDNIDYPLELKTELKNQEDLANIPILQKAGAVIYLSDIATITRGFKDSNTSVRTTLPGTIPQKSVSVSVSKQAGYNIEDITEAVDQMVIDLQEPGEILHGLNAADVYDYGDYIRRDLRNLSLNGLGAIVLVFIAIIFVLGVKDSFIASIGIPISFLLAFIAFLLVGNTINFLSLFSMILAIGILVDSDIVITEGIAAEKEKGLDEEKAARRAIRRLAGPMISGTMTTVAVFVPLFFLSGIMGDFIAAIPFTVIFILLASQLVSIFVVPLLHSTEFKKFQKKKIKVPKVNFVAWRKKYIEKLSWVLETRKRRKTFKYSVIFFFFFTLFLLFSGIVKTEFFPGGDADFIFVEVEMPEGTTLLETGGYTREIEDLLSPADYYSSLVTTIGQGSLFVAEPGAGDNWSNILINIKENRKDDAQDIIADVRKELQTRRLEYARVSAQEDGPPGGAVIDVNVIADDSVTAKKAALLAYNILEGIEGVKDVKLGIDKNKTAIEIRLDRSKVALYNLRISTIANTIRSSTEGIELFEVTTEKTTGGEEKIDLILKSDSSVESLADLLVANDLGQKVKLGAVASFELKESLSNINHYDQQNAVSVTASKDTKANLPLLIKEFKEKFAEQNETGAELIFGGEYDQQQTSQTETTLAFFTGVLLIFGILIFVFNSIRLPLIIESVIPLAFSGVVIGLLLTGNPLSFPAMLGFIALTGIVVNNSIILIYIFENKLKKGSTPKKAVLAGSEQRLRPILLTTVTTTLGVAPLIFAAAIWAPIAYAIIFGLIFSTVLTLFFVPILYLGRENRDSIYWAIKRKWRNRKQRG